jgi:hypothetical protein
MAKRGRPHKEGAKRKNSEKWVVIGRLRKECVSSRRYRVAKKDVQKCQKSLDSFGKNK